MKKRETSQRVTIRTVAADAGVSVATASKVLRDAYGVSQSAKDRVRASMRKLSYRPQAAARGMRGQTYTLGVLLPDLHNPFFDEIMNGVHSFLASTPYQALLGIGQSEINQEFALVHNMIDRQMDGLLMVAPRLTGKQIEDIAGQAPTVLIGLHEPKAVNYDTVNNDDFESGRLAVHHLHEGGRRRIVFFSLVLPPSIEESTIVVHRERGYRTAMNELKLARFSRVVFAGQDRGSIRDQALHLLRSRTRPEAIFCWTDFVAFEVMSVARELGLVVPGDVAIMGHDNTAFCDLNIASLTSIDQSGPLLGEHSARLLIERIEGRTKAEFLTVIPKIIARGSTKVSAGGTAILGGSDAH